ncbi:MAG: xanthine dehydrogenase family protein subunit M [Desulfobacterales bacterium]|nr:xanthine dehydrogenase family protein subunit M [Desulfobacterales bacterium]
MSLPKFEYLACTGLAEACSLLSRHADVSKILAGGTDLLVKMKHRRSVPRYIIDIKSIPDLAGIQADENGLHIGALTFVQAVSDSALVRKYFPMLGQAAGKLGTPHIRNLGTLGGNLANASPAAEFAPALLTLDARVTLVRAGGERTLPLEDFFTGPGRSAMEADEILTRIHIPHRPGHAGAYLKYSIRPMDVAMVNLAVMAVPQDGICREIKIALGAVGPVPFRARRAEAVIRGRPLGKDLNELFPVAARAAAEESRAISDYRATAAHRTRMVVDRVQQGLEQAFSAIRSCRQKNHET